MFDEKDLERGRRITDGNSAAQQQNALIQNDSEKAHDLGTEKSAEQDHSRSASSIDSINPAVVGDLNNIAPSTSEASSLRTRPVSIVPRSKRRGLLGRFAIIPEVERPKEYPNSTKWLITLIVALAGVAAPIGSAIFFPSLQEVSADFNTTPTVTNLSVALYMLSLAVFPLWWSSFSETLGRRTIYLVSFSLYTIWGILSAVSTSIGMLIVMRILSGGASASVQAVGAGTIADIWESKERGRAMGIFYLGPLMGPLLAPIIGGALAERFGWRSTQWFLVIYGGVLLMILIICLPETLQVIKPAVPESTLPTRDATTQPQLTRISTRQSVHEKARTFATVFKRCFIDPLLILRYLRFPAVAITVYYASITFGSLYVINISIQQTFSAVPYSFSQLDVGLLYLPASLGYIMASVVGGPWSDRVMAREARAAKRYSADGKLILIPEDRMRENAWFAAAIYPAALIWYGWAAQKGLPWEVAAVANFFFGLGSMIIFSCSTTMLTEFMPKRSSNGVAVNNFVRNIFSCVGGVVGSPLIYAIGNGWLFTGLGVWAGVSASVVWLLRRQGPKWREEMDRAMNR